MGKIKYTKELLIKLINESNSWEELVNILGIKPGNSRSWVKNKILKFNLNTSHFSSKLRKKKKYNNSELFIENSLINRSSIRLRILKENLIEYKCHSCGCNDEWLGQKMPLILDHINGINNDNRLENLRFLCSNCDSIQLTYKNRNNKNLDKQTEKIRKKLERKITIQNEKIKENNEIINLILNSDIDYSKYGWGLKLSKLLNKTPQYSIKWVKIHMEEFYKKNCFRHKD